VALHGLGTQIQQIQKRLSASGMLESEFRTAVDRAYYGVFLMTRDGLGITTRGADAHRQVANGLRGVDRSMGDALEPLRQRRNRSSYDLGKTISAVYVPRRCSWRSGWSKICGSTEWCRSQHSM